MSDSIETLGTYGQQVETVARALKDALEYLEGGVTWVNRRNAIVRDGQAALAALGITDTAPACVWCALAGYTGLCDDCAAKAPAPAISEDDLLDKVLAEFERRTKAVPVGHEHPSRGASTYGWRRCHLRELREIAALDGLAGSAPASPSPGLREGMTMPEVMRAHREAVIEECAMRCRRPPGWWSAEGERAARDIENSIRNLAKEPT